MLATQRHEEIVRLLSERDSLRTKEAADLLGVTDETIRKDFEQLENLGMLLKIHGGAVAIQQARRTDPTLNERLRINREEKTRMAIEAVKHIKANETIFMDASSTVLALVPHLPTFPFTVVTNSHDVVTELSELDHIDTVCTGGLYERRSRSFVGLTAEKALLRFNIHRMFCSTIGMDPERGASDGHSRQAAFKEHVIASAEAVYLLADGSKLGKSASFYFADCKDLSTLITTTDADPEVLDALDGFDMNLIIT